MQRSIVKNYERYKGEIKFSITMVNAAFNRKKTFHQQTGLKCKEETSEVVHLEQSFVWC